MPSFPRAPHVGVLLAALVAALLVVPAAAGAERDAPEEHPLLQEARRDIAQVADDLRRARTDRDGLREAVAEVDERLAEVEQSVNDAAAAIERQELEVAAAAERLVELRAVVEETGRRLEERSVAQFMSGEASVGSVLAAGDLRDAVDRAAYLDRVAETDQVSLESAAAAQRALEGATERFDEETARLEQMQAEQEAVLAAVEELRAERMAALDSARGEIDELRQLEDDLDSDYDRIAELIESGVVTSVAATPPSTDGYSWPVCARLTSPFGYRWGRQHKGIDLAGAIGTPIAAAKGGQVAFAGTQGGYGNIVLIDHGDGIVTAYGHQSRIAVTVGQSVERGQLIGEVGNTGRSTGPHLHFETRVNGSAVDPMQYLPSGC